MHSCTGGMTAEGGCAVGLQGYGARAPLDLTYVGRACRGRWGLVHSIRRVVVGDAGLPAGARPCDGALLGRLNRHPLT